MTVSTTGLRITHNGNGTTTEFAFPFRFLANGDLQVILIEADGTEVAQVLNTNYTVAGVGVETGGTVTMLVALAAGQKVFIRRELELTQEIDYITGDRFPAETHETALDRLTMITQQMDEGIDRSLKITSIDAEAGVASTLPSVSPGSALIWNNTGTGFENLPLNFGVLDQEGTVVTPTIALLRTLSGTDGDYAFVAGYYTPGDGGGGPLRVWKTGAVGFYVDNGGSIIVPIGGDGSGAWVWEYSGAVNVKWFGAVGDGVADDTVAIQAALDYLNLIGGGELHLGPDSFRCDSPLIGYSNTAIVGTPGSTIDWSFRSEPFNTPGDEALLVFRGTVSAEILLTTDAVYKTNKISVPDASLFSEGDLVEVSMNDQGSFPDTSVATKSGQLNIISGAYTDTNNLVLDTAIFEPLNYTTVNGARIRKITPVENVKIEGITFKGTGRPVTDTAGDLGVRVFFGRNVTIRDCNFIQLDTKAVEVIGCHHFLIDNNEVYHDELGSTNSSVSYSISYSSSMYGTISNNKIVNCRHGIVSSHLSAALTNKYYGVSRFIVIDSNFVIGNHGDLATVGWGAAHAGISTHSDVEFIEIVNNTVSGCRFGINPRTWNITVSGNRLVENYSAGIYLSGNFHDMLFQGNFISGGIGIAQISGSDTTPHPNMRFINNTFESEASCALLADAVTISEGFEFSGNSIKNSTATGVAALWISGAFTGKLQNNTIDNVPSASAGLRLENTRGLLVTGNHIYRTARSINVASACPNTIIADNVFINNTGPIFSPAARGAIVSGNHELGTGVL